MTGGISTLESKSGMAEDGLETHKSTSPPSGAPALATESVLKPSDPIPDGSRKVIGIDFNDYVEKEITVGELVAGMSTMGFQASAIGEAVRIVNDMVK
jgi:deoxyhypusine synthase